jgi:hypothetical protein
VLKIERQLSSFRYCSKRPSTWISFFSIESMAMCWLSL